MSHINITQTPQCKPISQPSNRRNTKKLAIQVG